MHMAGLHLRGLFLALTTIVSLAQGCSPVSTGSVQGRPEHLRLIPGIYTTKWEIPDVDRAAGSGLPNDTEYLRRFPVPVKQPRFVSRAPMLGQTRFGSPGTKTDSGKMFFAIDESRGTGKGYDTLYFDANRNCDLTDDGRTSREARDDGFGYPGPVETPLFTTAVTAPISRLIPGNASGNPIALDLRFRIFRKHRLGHSQTDNWVRGCYGGTLATDKGRLHFQLWDLDLDGRYDDALVAPRQGVTWKQNDMVFLGRNKVPGRFGEMPKWVCAPYPVAAASLFYSRLYVFKPDPSGDKLDVSEYTGPRGKVAIELGTISGRHLRIGHRTPQLVSNMGLFSLPVSGSAAEIPTGDYSSYPFDIETAGSQKCRASVGFRYTKPITVRENRTTILPVTGEIRLAIEPGVERLVLKRGRLAYTRIRLLMPEGEVTRVDLATSVIPTFSLRDAAGKVAYKGQTNYGGGFYMLVSPIPGSLPSGRYTAVATMELGPFGGVAKTSRTVFVE